MNRRRFLTSSALAIAGAVLTPQRVPAFGRRGTFTPLRRGIGTFEERGGTIGYLITKDAFVVVDTQFPDSAATCLSGLQSRTGRAIDLVINTHHHGDHTSGNGVFRPFTPHILAHINVPALQRSAAERRGNTDSQVYADQTYDGTSTVDFGGEKITLHYFGPAHTGGDSVIHFEHADVAHMGDLVFQYRPPFIDVAGGASTRHWITVLERAHTMFTDKTAFIFGHANTPKYKVTGSRSDLFVMRDFLSALVEFVDAGIRAGTPIEHLSAIERLPGFPEHFLPDRKDSIARNIRTVYGELTAEGQPGAKGD